ncbi:endoglucanase [Salirhabdus euzebyi]|uniref:Endoglucanase n=1 Tax=Salirhabdus euzebyi TaxID=394506 RepID=A0A841Q4J7_9BACI|nr:M42 family metallopeptidase [Salirhabdus euzebyi]MBB6453336.1 endoglucanase [Salirhabdus euzebyi]
METTVKMLEDLTQAIGVPGNEKEARDVMKKYIEPYADDVYYDHLGSLIAERKGKEAGPKVMIAGHLDEVGFMVTQITEDGYLRFETLGGWWSQVMLAQRVTIATKNGNISGVIGSKPPHVLAPEERKKTVEIKDMFIDIGARDKAHVEEIGVRLGDSVVPVCPLTKLADPKLLMAKAWDNRIGCAITIEVMKRLAKEDHPNTLYGVGNVQEEVGLRGSRTSTQMVQPDIMFALDTGVAGDTPGISDKDATAKIGKGPQLFLFDRSMIPHKGLRDFVIEIAKENDIPFQYEVMPAGGTDAGAAHTVGKGVPSLALAIPTRYIHTSSSIIHYDDFEHTVNLVISIIKKLDSQALKTILENS